MPRLEKKATNDYHIARKVWGQEIWIENNPEFCGKFLHFERGGATSMHFHMEKVETMYCFQGSFEIDLVDPTTGEGYVITLMPGESLFIPRGQAHRIRGLEAMNDLIEFSTQHEDTDSYRVTRPTAP